MAIASCCRLPNLSLRARLRWALFCFGAAAALFLALGAVFIDETLEQTVIQNTLQAEAERALQADSDHAARSNSTLLRHYFQPAAGIAVPVPAVFERLTGGFHEDVRLDGRSYYVLVKNVTGGHLYVAYDTSRLVSREYWFAGAIALALVLILSAAARLGRTTAMCLTRPLSELAQAVRDFDPVARDTRIIVDHGDPELNDIAAAFNTYLARMDQFIAREQAFTQTASHELRTPLSVISGAVEVIRARGYERGALAAPLGRIQRSAGEMTETVEALLFLARATSPEEVPPCRVDWLVAEMLARHACLVENRPLTLTLGRCEPTTIAAPRRMLAILISNLLRNSVQNTPRGHVTAGVIEGAVCVIDTGEGLDPILAARFLNERAGAAAEAARGHGLGLYIVGQVCARYGWPIEIGRNPDGGTCTRIILTGPTTRTGVSFGEPGFLKQ